MAQTLQYKTTAQRARIQTSSAGIHHPVAGKANHELTFKPDQSGGAGQVDLDLVTLADSATKGVQVGASLEDLIW
jgi:hypothetical protein